MSWHGRWKAPVKVCHACVVLLPHQPPKVCLIQELMDKRKLQRGHFLTISLYFTYIVWNKDHCHGTPTKLCWVHDPSYDNQKFTIRQHTDFVCLLLLLLLFGGGINQNNGFHRLMIHGNSRKKNQYVMKLITFLTSEFQLCQGPF